MNVKKSKSLQATKTLQAQLNLLQLQNQAMKAESRGKSEFIVNIIHDLRSPLAGIAGLANHLVEKTTNIEEKQYAKVIFEGSKQLLDLLNTIIDSKGSFNQESKVMKESLHLSEIIEKIRELEEPSVLDKHLKLEVNIDEKIPVTLISDKLKLERILLNLVSNAVKFTAKGLIKIEIRLVSKVKDKAQIEFSVSDTGVGISLDKQNKVFKRYFKDNASAKTHYSSSGLGLDIVQKYVKLLGGEISLKSKVNEGTTFTLVLPMRMAYRFSAETKNVASLDKEVIDSNFLDKKLKFLLVEDNPIMLTSMKLMMDTLGIKPKTAVNSETAINLIHEQSFDVIITDIELPDGSGYSLSKKIRTLEKQQGQNVVTIIGLTGHPVSEIIRRCKKAGMDEVYQKPLDLKQLRDLLQKQCVSKQFSLKKGVSKMKLDDIVRPHGKLGVDLPDSEDALFKLEQYPLFDMELGADILGSEEFVRTILASLDKAIEPDLKKIKENYKKRKWEEIQTLVHRTKSSAEFGTVRLYFALLFMERYLKAGYSHCQEALYAQMLQVMGETLDELRSRGIIH